MLAEFERYVDDHPGWMFATATLLLTVWIFADHTGAFQAGAAGVLIRGGMVAASGVAFFGLGYSTVGALEVAEQTFKLVGVLVVGALAIGSVQGIPESLSVGTHPFVSTLMIAAAATIVVGAITAGGLASFGIVVPAPALLGWSPVVGVASAGYVAYEVSD